MSKKEALKEAVKNYYTELGKNEISWPISHKGELISTFEAQVGKEFPEAENNGILFYGRACNGWDWTCPNGVNDDRETYDMFNMEKDSSIRPFCKFCKLVSQPYYPERWYDHIGWSNITKLTFCSGNNPSEELWQKQREYIEPILAKEMDILSPAIAIFVIGNSVKSGYETPLFHLYPTLLRHKLQTIQWGTYKRGEKTYPLTSSAYDLNGKLIIVTDRPEHQQYMDEHVACIQEMIKRFTNN